MWMLLAAACTTEADIAAEMERSLLAANEALVASTAAAEWFRWTDAPPTTTARHATDCGCPCRTRVDHDAGFDLLLDYVDAGCIPDSGLVALPVSGHAQLAVDAAGQAALTTEALAIAGDLVDTDLTGSASDAARDVYGQLGLGGHGATLDVRVAFTDDALVFEGWATAESGEVELDAVRVRLADIGSLCPRPSGGTIRVAADDEPVEIVLSEDQAVATWRDRTSSPARFCDYAPPWY